MLPKTVAARGPLALGACGGPADPTVETRPHGSSRQPAERDPLEPELVATDRRWSADDGSVRARRALHCGCRRRSRRARIPTRSRSPRSSGTAARTASRFDPLLERWREQQPDYVNFVRVPAVWNPTLVAAARARVLHGRSARQGRRDACGVFPRDPRARQRARLPRRSCRNSSAASASTPPRSKPTFDSFAVQAKLQRADELSRRYRIDSVPTIIVNGKYTTDGPHGRQLRRAARARRRADGRRTRSALNRARGVP